MRFEDIQAARDKKRELARRLGELDSILVAFSGGVDSTFLLAVAREALGRKAVAATATSPTYPSREINAALEFTRERGIEHIVFESDETRLPEFRANRPDRCYYCKKSLSQELKGIADKEGIKHIALASNSDDLDDYRPGIKAAQEMGMIEPLVDVGLGKDEIRLLSREMGLPTWNKPAMACLASRFPYGETITEEKLRKVSAAEDFLAENGFRQFRVRYHGPVARIEVEKSEIPRMLEPWFREKIVEKLRTIGFLHVALDLEGYVTGSLNRALEKQGASGQTYGLNSRVGKDSSGNSPCS
ncbi:MAG: ATP-dependent sacrificial sulfur transferase LarE [Deltaproteobacteria bacterium]|nr:ATP-dependent sacrificial sulfur transferase LarE [Deltaproteobacteria bacterium]